MIVPFANGHLDINFTLMVTSPLVMFQFSCRKYFQDTIALYLVQVRF